MPLPVAQLLVNLFLVYLLIGIVFAIVFVLRGVGVVDPVAREGTRGFKLLILPGCAAFWPWLLIRWLKGETPKDERNAHRDAAQTTKNSAGGTA